MRLLPGLFIIISFLASTPAEARLFWQTYGATVSTAEGYGCSWNWNQDYFVPRHSSSCRYGNYSPCKTSCLTSPACRVCHPFYPGYCGIYGSCHYRRRNHVYSATCGCQAVPSHGGCPADKRASCWCAAGNSLGEISDETMSSGYCEAPLYNVEPAHLDILGSIPVEGGDLLTKTDFSALGDQRSGLQLLKAPSALPLLQEGLPSLGLPKSGQLPQP